jgi:radical SAM protein with 4Fe4S-binding SPASM domain
MDKRLAEKVFTIKQFLPNCSVKIITNGDGLRTAGQIETLLSAGVDKIHMNHYDGQFAHIRKARDSQYQALSHFGISYLKGTFNNRAGKVDYEPMVKVKRCDWFLNKLVFNFKGDVLLCCSDFNAEVVFGNIMEQPLSMILGGELYQKYLRAHKKGEAKKLPLCEKCNRLL